MIFSLTVSDWMREHYPHLPSQLVAELEPRVTDIEATRAMPQQGEMSLETVCLVINTTVPILALLYTVLHGRKKSRDEAMPTRIQVNINSTVYNLAAERDCYAVEEELKKLPEASKIDLRIDRI